MQMTPFESEGGDPIDRFIERLEEEYAPMTYGPTRHEKIVEAVADIPAAKLERVADSLIERHNRLPSVADIRMATAALREQAQRAYREQERREAESAIVRPDPENWERYCQQLKARLAGGAASPGSPEPDDRDSEALPGRVRHPAASEAAQRAAPVKRVEDEEG